MIRTILAAGMVALLLSGCGKPPPGDRLGLAHDEVLVQISATGTAETRPDEARFSVGVSSIETAAAAATAANARKMNAIVAGLRSLGVAERDIQTRQLTVGRIDYGPNRNRFEVNNVVMVRVRDITKTGSAIAAATTAGANVLSGPDLRIADPEAAARAAYANAFRAASARAQTYADAAGLKVARTLAIRDGGQSAPPMPYEMDAMSTQSAPRPVVAPPVMGGTTSSQVTVAVDFALAPK